MVRLLIDTFGARYKEQHLIAEQSDIYYLEVDEVLSLASDPRDMKKTVKERKEQYEMYNALPPYSRIIFESREFNKNHASINAYHKQLDENELAGVPCSGGIAEGEALVIMSQRSGSEPYFSMAPNGSMALPRRFDIF